MQKMERGSSHLLLIEKCKQFNAMVKEVSVPNRIGNLDTMASRRQRERTDHREQVSREVAGMRDRRWRRARANVGVLCDTPWHGNLANQVRGGARLATFNFVRPGDLLIMIRPILMTVTLAIWAASGSAQVQVLASGTVDLEASSGPGDPNFNSPITRMHVLPVAPMPAAGSRLIVSLRDISQPDQFCDPSDSSGGLFDGCATVDWPFPGRRGINLVEIELTSGAQTLHLRMDDTLADDPEPDGP